MNEEKGKIIFKDGKRYKVVDEEPNEDYELKKQSNLEQKALVFRAGQEYKVVVEDYSTYKNSHFADIYEQAGKQTMKIISRNKEVEKDKKYSGDFYNNILAFIGDRGTGKTSCMQSFSNLLLNENYLESLNKKNMKFNDLGIVDPSMFDDRGNLLELVLATMFKKFKKNIENNNSNENQKRKTLESFNKVYKNLQHLNGKKEDLYKEDAIDALIKLSAANDFKSNFKELVDLYLGYMNSDSSNSENILIIQIDDIDLNTSHAYEMVEQIRKYMILPNMVILMAVKLPQLFDAIKQQLIIENKALLDQNSIDVKELASMTEKYLGKLIPVEHRLLLPKLEDFDRSLPLVVESADPNRETFKADSVEAGVRELIYTRTGMYFTSPKYHDNYIVPNNLRELNNLVVVLYNLEKIKDTADEKAKKLFKHHFDVEIEDDEIAENRIINILDGIDENYLKIFACDNLEFIQQNMELEYKKELTDYDKLIKKIYYNFNYEEKIIFEVVECILILEKKKYILNNSKDLENNKKLDISIEDIILLVTKKDEKYREYFRNILIELRKRETLDNCIKIFFDSIKNLKLNKENSEKEFNESLIEIYDNGINLNEIHPGYLDLNQAWLKLYIMNHKNKKNELLIALLCLKYKRENKSKIDFRSIYDECKNKENYLDFLIGKIENKLGNINWWYKSSFADYIIEYNIGMGKKLEQVVAELELLNDYNFSEEFSVNLNVLKKKDLETDKDILLLEVNKLKMNKVLSLFPDLKDSEKDNLILEDSFAKLVKLIYEKDDKKYNVIKKAFNINLENSYVKKYLISYFPKELGDLFSRYAIKNIKIYNSNNNLEPQIKQLEWFKNYFIENWCYNNLSSKDLEIILTLDQKGVDEKNKYIILQLKNKLEKLLKENEYEQFKKTFEGYEEVIELNNTSINLSLGDMTGILECYKKYDMSDKSQRFVYSIETIYSLSLYKYYLEKNSKKLKINKKNYDHYDVLIGGGFYNYKFISILRKEDNIKSRDERIFDVEKLKYNGNNDVQTAEAKEFIRLFLKNISSEKYRVNLDIWYEKKIANSQQVNYFNVLFGFHQENEDFFIGNIDLIEKLLNYKFYDKIYQNLDKKQRLKYGNYVVEFWDQFIKFYYSDGIIFFNIGNSSISNRYRELTFSENMRQNLVSLINPTSIEKADEIIEKLKSLKIKWRNNLEAKVKVIDFFEENIKEEFEKEIKLQIQKLVEDNEFKDMDTKLSNNLDLYKRNQGTNAQEKFINQMSKIIESLLEEVKIDYQLMS